MLSGSPKEDREGWKVDKKVYGWTAGVEISTVVLHNVLGSSSIWSQ